LSATESRFIEKKVELPATLIERAEASHPGDGFKNEAEWLRCVKEDFPKFIPFLTKQCRRGMVQRRTLETSAGGRDHCHGCVCAVAESPGTESFQVAQGQRGEDHAHAG
jgi:hypothetical protein